MVLIRWKNPFSGGVPGCYERLKNFVTLFRLRLCLMIARVKFVVYSLTYNEHMSYNYVVEFFMEPIHWFVDNFAVYLGQVFVFCVSVLTTAVVLIAYWVGLPYWWERNRNITVFLVILGNWLLVNIIFHYYMAVTTSPGYPPHNIYLSDAASLCKKCITPKPQRTHHCSVCDRCVLGMDHHCPWLNNCVGYFNARYFYLYILFTVAGVMFIIIAGLDLGYQVMWVNDSGGLLPINDPDLIGHSVRISKTGTIITVKVLMEYDEYNLPREHDLPVPPLTQSQRICAHPWKRRAVFFMAYTCIVVLFALGVLATMHGLHIDRGETSVESQMNKKARVVTRLFRHPYDFGRSKNWRLFLGLTQGRTFIRHVLFPSAHPPIGDGVFWYTVHNLMELSEEWP